MSYLKEYHKWLSFSCLTDEQRKELISLEGDTQELASRFCSSLNFGTAGLRGKTVFQGNCRNSYVYQKH